MGHHGLRILLVIVSIVGLASGYLMVEFAERWGLIRLGPATRLSPTLPPPDAKSAPPSSPRPALPAVADPRILSDFGDTRKAAGDHQQALEAYTAALRFRPQDADILFRSGLVRMELGDYQGANAHLSLALVSRPRDVGMLFTRGNARAALNQLDDAHKDFTAVIGIMPQQAAFYQARASILERLGRKAEADADRGKAAKLK